MGNRDDDLVGFDMGSIKWGLGASSLTASVFYFVAVYILPYRVPEIQNPAIYYAMDAVGTAVIFFAPAFLFTAWVYYEIKVFGKSGKFAEQHKKGRTVIGEMAVGTVLGLGLYTVNLWAAGIVSGIGDVLLNPMLLTVYLVFAVPTHVGRNLMFKMYPQDIESIVDIRRVVIIYALQFGIVMLMYLFLVEMLLSYGVV